MRLTVDRNPPVHSSNIMLRVPFFLGGEDTPESRSKMMSTIPLGRFALPADVGNTAAWLASDEASLLTGASIDVDGGRGI